MLLNFHTHIQGNEGEIYNVILPQKAEITKKIELPNQWVSIGVHPWHIDEEFYKNQLQKLSQLVCNQQVKLIGECGLDRLKGASLALQEEVFIQQIQLAERVKKPIIIHCVKYFNELFLIQKKVKPAVPMILHGFNQKFEIGSQLLEKGFYLSLGTAILQENSGATKILKEIPLEKLFLETDNKEILIDEIYSQAAKIREISVEELSTIIWGNFAKIINN